MNKIKKYLEAENKWLWYNHLDIQDDAELIEINQYDKKGELIVCSSMLVPPKKYRAKHPDED